MSEEWRRKTYYSHRVLIDTQDVIDNPYPDLLVCLSGAHVGIIRRLLEYAHWRSTFVSERFDTYYLAPSTEEWDAIEKIVADLESRLTVCEEMTAALQSIADAIACMCGRMPYASTSSYQGGTPYTLPLIEGLVGDGLLSWQDTSNGQDTVVDEDRCAIANLCWQQAYEILTELLIPGQDSAIDVLLPASLASLAVMLGVPALALPAGFAGVMIADAIALFVDGDQASVQSDYISYKEELICAIYEGLAVDVNSAVEAVQVIIDGIGDLGPIDKLFMKVFFHKVLINRMIVAWTNQSAWALANYDQVDCAECGLIIGSDWYAVPIFETVHIDHPAGSSWATGNIQYVHGTSNRAVGAVFAWVETGTCQGKRMDTQCGGGTVSIWDNSSDDLVNGTQYWTCQAFQINDTEAKATLCPTATTLSTGTSGENGPCTLCFSWQIGYNCTGNADPELQYIVFKGSP